MQVTPSNDKPYPDSFADEVGASLKENARVSAKTATLMAELGMPFEMTEEDEALARELFESFDVPKREAKRLKNTTPFSLHRLCCYQTSSIIRCLRPAGRNGRSASAYLHH